MNTMNEALTGIQTRLGRALLGWSVKQLSECSKVSVSTIKRIEAVDGIKRRSEFSTLSKIEQCLSDAISEKQWRFSELGIEPKKEQEADIE